jgi:hypothetical protein
MSAIILYIQVLTWVSLNLFSHLYCKYSYFSHATAYINVQSGHKLCCFQILGITVFGLGIWVLVDKPSFLTLFEEVSESDYLCSDNHNLPILGTNCIGYH